MVIIGEEVEFKGYLPRISDAGTRLLLKFMQGLTHGSITSFLDSAGTCPCYTLSSTQCRMLLRISNFTGSVYIDPLKNC